MTPEEKQQKMNAERSIMKNLLTSAMNDDVVLLKETIQGYTVDAHSGGGSKAFVVLGQFKDGRKRTAMHFAAQSFSVRVLEYILGAISRKVEVSVAAKQGMDGLGWCQIHLEYYCERLTLIALNT